MLTRRMLVLVALGTSCASPYVYKPDENATAHMNGKTAADYKIPAAAPSGDVRIASFGVATIAAKEAPPGQSIRAMHLRMIVANNSNQAWSVDTREQRLELAGHGKSRVAFATADAQGPVVEIPPGGKGKIDLFFPLPQGMQRAGKIPEFDALWEVKTQAGLVKERTPFERLRIDPPMDDGTTAAETAYYGWGGAYGWYNPLYPTDGFNDPSVLSPFYIGPRIAIGPPGWR